MDDLLKEVPTKINPPLFREVFGDPSVLHAESGGNILLVAGDEYDSAGGDQGVNGLDKLRHAIRRAPVEIVEDDDHWLAQRVALDPSCLAHQRCDIAIGLG